MEMRLLWVDLRAIRRQPILLAISASSIALGVAVSTVLFALFLAVAFPEPPFGRQEEIFAIQGLTEKGSLSGIDRPTFFRWREAETPFEAMAAIGWIAPSSLTGADARRIRAFSISDGFFDLLGVPLQRGREFAPEDIRQSRRLAIIGHGLWLSHFGRQEVLGRLIELDGTSYEIVGVMPPDFRILHLPIDVFVPMSASKISSGGLHAVGLAVYARTSGALPAQTKASLLSLAGDSQDFVREGRSPEARIYLAPIAQYYVDALVGPEKREIVALSIVFGLLVLAMSFSNVVSLAFSNALRQHRDFAVRRLLGAGRWRFCCLPDSLLTALLGVAIAMPLVDLALRQDLAQDVLSARYIRLEWDLRLMAFALGCGALYVVGLAGARGLFIGRLSSTLSVGNWTGPTRHRKSLAATRLFVGIEIAIAAALTLSTALLAHSAYRLSQVDPGFDPENLIALEVSFPAPPADPALTQDPFPVRRSELEAVRRRLKSQPGVAEVAWSTDIFSEIASRSSFVGRPARFPLGCTLKAASSNYLQTMRIALRQGRMFEAQEAYRPVAVLTDRSYPSRWPTAGPIGDRIEFRSAPDHPLEVIGVAASSRELGLQKRPDCVVYIPYEQGSSYLPWHLLSNLTVLVRTQVPFDGDALANLVSIVKETRGPVRPIVELQSMKAALSSDFGHRRFVTACIGGGALAAVALALIGLFSMVSYDVRSRLHEIGVRMAMGASPGRIRRMVVWRTLVLVGIALLPGILISVNLNHLFRSLLFSLEGFDPLSGLASILLIVSVGAYASWLPAAVASRRDPTRVLQAP